MNHDVYPVDPLADDPATTWAVYPGDVVSKMEDTHGTRFRDPGNLIGEISEVHGAPTGLCVLGNNVAGVAGWTDLSFATQYASLLKEAGAFPCGGMYYMEVCGPAAGAVLDEISPFPVSTLEQGRATFVIFPTAEGTVDTEAIVVRVGPTRWLLSVGGDTKPPARLPQALEGKDAYAAELSLTSFNLKGPRRVEMMQRLVADGPAQADVAKLEPFRMLRVGTVTGGSALVLRTMIGIEMWAEPADMNSVWRFMLVQLPGVVPCGWDVLATFRVECTAMLFALCPLDMNRHTTLREVGQGRLLDKSRPGDSKTAPSEAAPRQWLGGLIASSTTSRPPEVGDPILSENGGVVGYVTTSAISPKYNRSLCFGLLRTEVAAGGTVLTSNSDRWVVSSIPFSEDTVGRQR
jgi:aminomethyltransferase